MHHHTQPTSGLGAGQVTLVGAGPGDPELLTLKAVKAIACATLLLVDDLVNPEILKHANPQARVVHVGKRGGCASTPQAFIHQLMIQAAQEGHHVVRLKGGDPFVFGRGGEEMAQLQALGIGVSVINGITSGLAAVSSLNVALTHRDRAHGVVFVTGHTKPGDQSTNWAALAQAAQSAKLTLVIYMGISGLSQITPGLLQHLPAETPVALIQHATLPHQRQVLGQLSELTALAQTHGIGSPAIVVVGDVLLGVQACQSSSMESRRVA